MHRSTCFGVVGEPFNPSAAIVVRGTACGAEQQAMRRFEVAPGRIARRPPPRACLDYRKSPRELGLFRCSGCPLRQCSRHVLNLRAPRIRSLMADAGAGGAHYIFDVAVEELPTLPELKSRKHFRARPCFHILDCSPSNWATWAEVITSSAERLVSPVSYSRARLAQPRSGSEHSPGFRVKGTPGARC
jgi:hypothetical protein